MALKVRLDSRGIGKKLRSAEMRRMVDRVAERVAKNVRAQGHRVSDGQELPVDVRSFTSDRAGALVAITHPAGIGMQAKYGVLTRAAGDAGLTVVDR